MKKLIALIIPFIFLGSSYSEDFRFGVFIDPQISWLTPDIKDIEKDGARLSIKGGLIIDFFFAENYAFTTGLSISNSGGNLLYSDSLTLEIHGTDQKLSPESTVNYKLQYLTIPIGLKFKTKQLGYLTFFAHLGLAPEINVKATADASDDQLENDNITDEVNFFNLSYYFGGGLEYSLGGNTALFTGINSYNGFIDVLTSKDSKETQSLLSISLGIMF